MREILFRGKRIDNGEWVEGYVGVFKGKTDIFVPFTAEEEKENEGHIFSVIGGLWHTVDPSTVGQFASLSDKNGKKIFEGDILKFNSRMVTLRGEPTGGISIERNVVVWGEYGWCKMLVYSNRWTDSYNTYGYTDHLYKETTSKYAEVIGNIHDNPELLENQ